ncbi:hypothetical protein EVAR_81558_1 [Eumeta japonica]|uniref:Uncharacterized protein n=1 Tax=Eumeta variegata TaxID=151549 RepID=A0A4C1V0P0_EUMVA|nr:hypothetical protein EVAR_81558_1 [Eumeta japonica]
MTPREHRDAKKKWKVHCTKYRSKKKVLANITNSFIKENTPDSDASASCQMVPEVVVRNNKNKEKMLRYRIKKKRDEEIKELKRKVLKDEDRKEKRLVVKLLSKTNMEYRYVSIIDKIDEEMAKSGHILKLCDNKANYLDTMLMMCQTLQWTKWYVPMRMRQSRGGPAASAAATIISAFQSVALRPSRSRRLVLRQRPDLEFITVYVSC